MMTMLQLWMTISGLSEFSIGLGAYNVRSAKNALRLMPGADAGRAGVEVAWIMSEKTLTGAWCRARSDRLNTAAAETNRICMLSVPT